MSCNISALDYNLKCEHGSFYKSLQGEDLFNCLIGKLFINMCLCINESANESEVTNFSRQEERHLPVTLALPRVPRIFPAQLKCHLAKASVSLQTA